MMAIAPAGAHAGPSSLARCAAGVVAYLALAGTAAWSGLVQCGLRPGVGEAVLCAAPAFTGLALAFASRSDRRQYVTRLVAAGLMLPLLLLLWAGTQEPESSPGLPVGLFVATFALLHLMAAVSGVALLAAASTRIDAVRGVAPVGAIRLGRRLASLNHGGLALVLQRAASDSVWQVEIGSEAGRTHRLRLEIDDGSHQVTVHERLGVAAPAPRDDAGASPCTAGADPGDAARPAATAGWSHEWQATMIEEALLRATVLAFDGDRALPPQAACGYDAATLVRLLCALVTRSGYAWQPVWPSWPRRRRARR